MKVMLLAAGRGERMGALTDTTPKPLLPVAGKPLLQHHIERLVAAGFSEIVINTAYLGEQIAAFIGDGRRFGVPVRISAEKARLETGGGIFNALGLLGTEPFAVVNSDVWTDFPLHSLPRRIDDLAHLVRVPNPPHNTKGDFGLNGNRCVSEGGNERLTFSGISILQPALFKDAVAGKFPLAPLLRQAMNAGRVSGERHDGIWIDVGTPERLRAVEHILQENRQ
jgi:MurNAc alpha-1-phosphate uridylyltransferase